MKVMVTSAKSRIAYNVVKCLGSRGIDVYPADFVKTAMSFASRYSVESVIYPSPFSDQNGFIQKLIDEIHRLKIDILIPVYEETFLISKYKRLLSQHVRMVIPDYDKILTAHNKDHWSIRAQKMGIPVPNSYEIETITKGKINTHDMRYPLLIKPKQGGGAWGITRVNTAKELNTIVSNPRYDNKEWNRFFIQEIIEGNTICVAMLYNKGKIRAKAAYKQLRDFPVSGGQATLRESVRNIEAENYFEKFLEALEWHGVCQADFIVDRKKNIPYLIDINPRLWGSLAQAIACGIDFPYLMYKMAVDGDVEPQLTFKSGVQSRWIGGDIRAFLPQVRASDAKLKFIKNFFFPNQKAALLDDFSVADPLPFLIWSLDAINRMLKNSSLNPVMHDQLDGIWE